MNKVLTVCLLFSLGHAVINAFTCQNSEATCWYQEPNSSPIKYQTLNIEVPCEPYGTQGGAVYNCAPYSKETEYNDGKYCKYCYNQEYTDHLILHHVNVRCKGSSPAGKYPAGNNHSANVFCNKDIESSRSELL